MGNYGFTGFYGFMGNYGFTGYGFMGNYGFYGSFLEVKNVFSTGTSSCIPIHIKRITIYGYGKLLGHQSESTN